MSRPIVNAGNLYWTGEHWINFIREAGADQDSGMVSLWHTRYCQAGNGTVAYVQIAAEPGFAGICTDNPAIATFIQHWMRGRGGLYDQDLPVIETRFHQSGDIRTNPAWHIHTGQTQIVATWTQIEPPVILEAPAPKFSPDSDVFSLLFFAGGASITLNDQVIAGQPYLRDIWQPSIGGERSSCVFALSETFIDVPA